MTDSNQWREIYRIDSISPVPPGWHAIFLDKVSNDGDEGAEWLELSTRPLLSLACVRRISVRGLRHEPTDEEWRNALDAEIEIHGLVADDDTRAAYLTIVPDEGDFIGYQGPGQMLELFLSRIDNPKNLPVVIATPDQKRQRENRWADECKATHNVIDLPALEAWLASHKEAS